ncbi:MAG: ABC transporter permease [Lachnospiraceae bacterium]
MKNRNYYQRFLKKDLKITVLIAAFLLVIVFLAIVGGSKFFSINNIQSIMFQIPEFSLLAIAMMLCMLAGGIDLSVVAIANLTSVIAALMVNKMLDGGMSENIAMALALIIALSVSVVCGLINGILIGKLNILPILVTLSMMILIQGFAKGITKGKGITGFPSSLLDFGTGKMMGIPVIFIVIVIIAVIIWFFLDKTRYGKALYLYGDNKVVTLFSAINNAKVAIITYTVSGFLSGIAGIIMMARNNSAKVGYGDIYQLQAILVCCIGGINPDGGAGRIIGVCIAIILLQFLQSGFNIMGYDPYAKKLIWGLVLVAVMIMDYFIDNSKSKHKK